MYFINPFKGLRPTKKNVSSVAVSSTDHLSEDIRRDHLRNNPWSYLNVFNAKNKEKSKEQLHTNPVDGKDVPVPHFGVILEWDDFDKFSKHLIEKGVEFIIEPYIRFKGLAGEQATMFFKDPAGNALEFKSFKDFNQIFEKQLSFVG